MISSNPAATEVNTILNGIAYMWDEGDRLIAAVIFSASILVPVLKIAAMSVLIASARFALPTGAKKLSHLYRITEAVGRWSATVPNPPAACAVRNCTADGRKV